MWRVPLVQKEIPKEEKEKTNYYDILQDDDDAYSENDILGNRQRNALQNFVQENPSTSENAIASSISANSIYDCKMKSNW